MFNKLDTAVIDYDNKPELSDLICHEQKRGQGYI